jgi:hypothetical protein
MRTMLDGGTDSSAAGLYADRVVEEGGVLKFAERVSCATARAFDALLATPL